MTLIFLFDTYGLLLFYIQEDEDGLDALNNYEFIL